jgi:hypothetical protein
MRARNGFRVWEALILKIGSHEVGRNSPSKFFNKYILPHYDKRRRVKNELDSQKQIIVNVNNFCNLDCFSCGSMCDKPFNNPWRDKPRVIDPIDVDMALEQILEYQKYDTVTLAGGEPTTIPLNTLKILSNVIRSYSLKVHILTNAYRINKIDADYFDYITLDDHGTNSKAINEAVQTLHAQGYENYFIKSTLIHKDYDLALTTPTISQGVKCWGWLQPTIWLDIVYPCCGMPQMEGWHNDTILRDSLRRNGWKTKNPELAEVLRNWRETIPPEVLKKCLFSCWKHRESYREVNIMLAQKSLCLEDNQ